LPDARKSVIFIMSAFLYKRLFVSSTFIISFRLGVSSA
jgi:hypothetical protein